MECHNPAGFAMTRVSTGMENMSRCIKKNSIFAEIFWIPEIKFGLHTMEVQNIGTEISNEYTEVLDE
jgi:hypothetical protein